MQDNHVLVKMEMKHRIKNVSKEQSAKSTVKQEEKVKLLDATSGVYSKMEQHVKMIMNV
jgi:hypothetical protein